MSDPRGYCATCNNTGYIDCHCGGDLCVCGENEIECPDCGGMDFDDEDEDDEMRVVNVGDELHQILADALRHGE